MAWTPIFLGLANRNVTVMHSPRLTAWPCMFIIASDCNGKGDRPWADVYVGPIAESARFFSRSAPEK